MKSVKILFNDSLAFQLEKLKNEYGFPNFAQTVRFCVASELKRAYPAYTQKKYKTPEERVEDKLKKQQLENDIVKNRFRSVCVALGGNILTEEGIEYCEYYKYELMPGERISKVRMFEPVDSLSDKDIVSQYKNWQGDTSKEIKDNIINLCKKETL